MKIKVGIYSKCHQKDDKKAPNEPFYFSAGNELDFGNIPANLPELSLTEQMMISKIHVFTQIRQVRGAQYRYRGHCVSFTRNVAKVCVATTGSVMGAFLSCVHKLGVGSVYSKIVFLVFSSWGVGICSTPFYLLRCTVLVSGTIGPYPWLQLVPLGSDTMLCHFPDWSDIGAKAK